MGELPTKIVYYVSNYAEGTISIVDETKNQIIKKINCDFQPYDIVVGGKNKILVANSGSNTVSMIYVNRKIKTLKMPNNGHIDTNSNMTKGYVSSTTSIAAYDIENGSLLWRNDGFYSVKFIKLSNSKNRLFVLDDNLMKIYNANDGSFMGSIVAGNMPSFIEIDKNDGIAYVSNTLDNSVSAVDIDNLEVLSTIFNVGNAPIGMKLIGNSLYVANSLGNNISIINTSSNSVVSNILVGAGPERITSTPNDEKLLVSNTTDNTISIISLSTNLVEATIRGFNQPIGVVAVNSTFIGLYQIDDISELICIKTNKIFSRCASRICFKDIKIKNHECAIYPYTVNMIRFSNGYISPGSYKGISLQNNPSFSKIDFSLVVPYTLEYYDRMGKLFKVNNIVTSETISKVIYMPKIRSEMELRTMINTRSELLNIIVFKNGAFVFSVGTFFEISIVGEVDLLVPSCGYCSKPPQCEKYLDDSYHMCKDVFLWKVFPEDFYPRDNCLNRW